MNDSLTENDRQIITRSILASGDLAAIPLGELIGRPLAARRQRRRLSRFPRRGPVKPKA